jgi:hypothetical protein
MCNLISTARSRSELFALGCSLGPGTLEDWISQTPGNRPHLSLV